MRDALCAERADVLSQHQIASEALRGGNLEAANWFPDGTYPPALSFVGPRPPRRPPSPPTRPLTVLESGDVERGEIPVVEISTTPGRAESETDAALDDSEPKARGQPP